MKCQRTAVGVLLLSLAGIGLLSGCGPKETPVAPEELNRRQSESVSKETGAGPSKSNADSSASEVGGNPSAKK